MINVDDLRNAKGHRFMVSKVTEVDARKNPRPHQDHGSKGSFTKRKLRPGEVLVFEKLDYHGDIWINTVLVFYLERDKNTQVGVPLKTNGEVPFLIPIRKIPMAKRVASRWLQRVMP